MKLQLTLLLFALAGCSTVNILKGPDDHLKHFYADEVRDSIDRAIKTEVVKKLGPPGHATKGYSKSLWNNHWNSRIHSIYELKTRAGEEAYRGPSGPEFIRYIIEKRRENGLFELSIEERNLNRVPPDLLELNQAVEATAANTSVASL